MSPKIIYYLTIVELELGCILIKQAQLSRNKDEISVV